MLVPLPWIDDHFLARIRQRQVRRTTEEFDLHPTEIDVRILAGSEMPFHATGCIIGALMAATWRIARFFLRKIVRTLLFFLLIKEATEVASETFHEGYLLRKLLEDEPKAVGIGPERAWQIRRLIVATCAGFDTRPAHQILRRAMRGSRALMTWAITIGRSQDEKRRGRWERLVDSISEALWEQDGYLRALDKRLQDQLSTISDATPSSPGRI